MDELFSLAIIKCSGHCYKKLVPKRVSLYILEGGQVAVKFRMIS